MTRPRDPSDIDGILARLRAGESPDPGAAEHVAHLPTEERARVLGVLLEEPTARRWLRGEILPRLDPATAAAVADWLLTYEADFVPERRDRTTGAVVRALPVSELVERAPFLAGSNAAGVLWERLATAGPDTVRDAALRVFREGTPVARETTLYLLVLDPYGPGSLPDDGRRALVLAALADPDEEIRGLAAEVAADEAPDMLLADTARWVRDSAVRVRAAAWACAFAEDPERAAEDALALLVDEAEPLPTRRSALLALGEWLTTAQIEPVLTTFVRHPVQELAEDAAGLLWTRHRTPVAAQAASESPHATVRDIAARLLDPRLGSPLAGGFRSGAEEQGYDFYDPFRER